MRKTKNVNGFDWINEGQKKHPRGRLARRRPFRFTSLGSSLAYVHEKSDSSRLDRISGHLFAATSTTFFVFGRANYESLRRPLDLAM